MPNLEIREYPPDRPRRFQFSIRSMLILTAAVAMAYSFVYALPDWAAVLVFLSVLLLVPGPMICLSLFGAGGQRAFGLGTLVPLVLLWLLVLIHDYPNWLTRDPESRFNWLFMWLLCFLSGYLSLLTWRWIVKQNRASEKPSASSKLDG
ncbi:MAG TPA: hypothetical protein VJL29_01505 [Thermoguttaceae bacterium]|nr:hypothetical protein [Thermoguttaceae bacterium]